MQQTIAEKILSKHAGKDAHAGDLVLANVDFVMAQDGTAPLAIRAFEKMGQENVFDTSKVALVIDHSAPSPNEGVSALHKQMREFAQKQGIKMYDIGCGVCHQLIPEQGHVVPGNLMVGADSHTCSYGAINVFSTGVGSTDCAAAMASGQLWFKVPPTIKVTFNGTLPKGVYSKDLVLFLARQLTADGATYKALEFHGSAIEALSIEARLTIANMAIEMGAKAGLMLADSKTDEWIAAHSNTKYESVSPDADAVYEQELEFDVSNLKPQIAKPHTVDNVADIDEVAGTPIQQGVIGTCTNGRLEDLKIAVSILKKHPLTNGNRLIVAPASRQIYLDAMGEGVIQELVKAGASVVTPGCGPCVGTHNGVPSDGENVISTANRNFKGRMGNSNANIFLASPATVAASVIAGKITDPREYL